VQRKSAQIELIPADEDARFWRRLLPPARRLPTETEILSSGTHSLSLASSGRECVRACSDTPAISVWVLGCVCQCVRASRRERKSLFSWVNKNKTLGCEQQDRDWIRLSLLRSRNRINKGRKRFKKQQKRPRQKQHVLVDVRAQALPQGQRAHG